MGKSAAQKGSQLVNVSTKHQAKISNCTYEGKGDGKRPYGHQAHAEAQAMNKGSCDLDRMHMGNRLVFLPECQ